MEKQIFLFNFADDIEIFNFMTYEELDILIRKDEHRQLELKKTTGELKDGMHSACAFLNTEGGWLTKDDTKDDTKDCIKELSDRQYLMLRFITLDDTITIDEMIQKMKVSPITVKRDLADLQAKGIITREGGRKNGRWVILKSIQ